MSINPRFRGGDGDDDDEEDDDRQRSFRDLREADPATGESDEPSSRQGGTGPTPVSDGQRGPSAPGPSGPSGESGTTDDGGSTQPRQPGGARDSGGDGGADRPTGRPPSSRDRDGGDEPTGGGRDGPTPTTGAGPQPTGPPMDMGDDSQGVSVSEGGPRATSGSGRPSSGSGRDTGRSEATTGGRPGGDRDEPARTREEAEERILRRARERFQAGVSRDELRFEREGETIRARPTEGLIEEERLVRSAPFFGGRAGGGGGISLNVDEIERLADKGPEPRETVDLSGLAPGSVLSDALPSGEEGGGDTERQTARRERATPEQRLEAQLEAQTGTELTRGEDFTISQEGRQFRAELTEVGRARVAADTDLERTFDVFRARQRERFFGGIDRGTAAVTEGVTESSVFQSAAGAVERGTPGPDSPFITLPARAGEQSLDLVRQAPGGEVAAGVLAAGAPVAAAEPTPFGEIGVGGAALIAGGLAAAGVASAREEDLARAEAAAESALSSAERFASEIPVPAEGQAIRDRAEITVPAEPTGRRSELEVPTRTPASRTGEIPVRGGEDVLGGSELAVPEAAPGQRRTEVGVVRTQLLEQVEDEQPRPGTITGGDIADREQVRLPEEERLRQFRESVEERQRDFIEEREGFPAEREFPTGEEAVVGRGVTEPRTPFEEPEIGTEPTRVVEDTAVDFESATEPAVSAAAAEDAAVSAGVEDQIAELEAQAQGPAVGQRDATDVFELERQAQRQRQRLAEDTRFAEETVFEEQTAPRVATPTLFEEAQLRERLFAVEPTGFGSGQRPGLRAFEPKPEGASGGPSGFAEFDVPFSNPIASGTEALFLTFGRSTPATVQSDIARAAEEERKRLMDESETSEGGFF